MIRAEIAERPSVGLLPFADHFGDALIAVLLRRILLTVADNDDEITHIVGVAHLPRKASQGGAHRIEHRRRRVRTIVLVRNFPQPIDGGRKLNELNTVVEHNERNKRGLFGTMFSRGFANGLNLLIKSCDGFLATRFHAAAAIENDGDMRLVVLGDTSFLLHTTQDERETRIRTAMFERRQKTLTHRSREATSYATTQFITQFIRYYPIATWRFSAIGRSGRVQGIRSDFLPSSFLERGGACLR